MANLEKRLLFESLKDLDVNVWTLESEITRRIVHIANTHSFLAAWASCHRVAEREPEAEMESEAEKEPEAGDQLN